MEWELVMNIEKPHYPCVGEETTDLIFKNDKRIKKCNSYKYLEINLNAQPHCM